MNIAFVSYHFADATAEGLVSLKLAEALALRGHRVSVMTSDANPPAGSSGPSWSAPVAGVVVHRLAGDPADAPAWWRSLERRGGRNRLWDKVAAVPNLIHGCRVRDWSWIQAVVRRVARSRANDGPFDVLHSRLNPHMSHLAAMQIVRQDPACAWCAYFSDPWPHSLYPEPYRFSVGPVARRRLEHVLDAMLGTAGSLVFPSERLRNHLLNGRRLAFRSKAFVAPHLAMARTGQPMRPRREHMVIRHAGFLMKERRIEPLLGALRRLRRASPDAAASIRVEFAGRYQSAAMPSAPEDLADAVSFMAQLDADAAWTWMQDADVLLLVEAQMKEGIFFPSKLADYLVAGRPILALSPSHGVVSDMLSAGGGLIVPPDDEDGIAVALAELYRRWHESRLADLVPGPAQRSLVQPESVVPVYERAFQRARLEAGAIPAADAV